jgi:hypothetical protein
MNKEDWAYYNHRLKPYGVRGNYYKFRNANYVLYIDRSSFLNKTIGYFIYLPTDIRTPSISDIFEDANVGDEDKIALSYYVGLKFEGNYIITNDALKELVNILTEVDSCI